MTSDKGSAMMLRSSSLRSIPLKNARHCSTFIERMSCMVLPATFTYSASGRSLLPWQAEQTVRPLKRLSIYLYWIL